MTTKIARGQKRERDFGVGVDGTGGWGADFLRAARPTLVAAGGSLAMTASSAVSNAPASLNRAPGFFAIAFSTICWNNGAELRSGCTFDSNGIGWVRCAPM